MMSTIFEEYFKYTLSNASNEEILFSIFEFLQNHIPFDVISCASANRKDKVYTAFVEYSLNETHSSYSYALHFSYFLAWY